jgi:DNA replication and repair protein RecF
MYVEEVELVDFRSYAHVYLGLEPGPVVLLGNNGMGKTNLVEAIAYLAHLDSHRVASTVPLVRRGAEQAIVRARVRRDERTSLLEVEIVPGRGGRARINGGALPRQREILGLLQTVTFAPEDLSLVKGDPSDRRRFLDETLTLLAPRYAGVRADYDRVVRQRSALLKSSSGRRAGVEESLDVWDGHLARVGAELIAGRIHLVEQLRPYVVEAYEGISAGKSDASLTYASRLDFSDQDRLGRPELTEILLEQLRLRRPDELARGVCLVGPHRDDLDLVLGGMPTKGYASQGESWSFALALKIGAFRRLARDGDTPVLILDDVFSELDAARRAQLVAQISTAEQVIVTAAAVADVPDELRGTVHRVTLGSVTRD